MGREGTGDSRIMSLNTTCTHTNTSSGRPDDGDRGGLCILWGWVGRSKQKFTYLYKSIFQSHSSDHNRRHNNQDRYRKTSPSAKSHYSILGRTDWHEPMKKLEIPWDSSSGYNLSK